MKNLLLLLSMLLLLACGENKETDKAAPMHWDRDMCARCVMVISDRKNSVQVIENKSKKVYKFDDLGCMVIWAKDNSKDIKNSKVWVTDANTGEWIDAKKAFYTSGNVTPMAYGFSAYKSKENLSNTMTFDKVYKEILDK